MKPRMPGATGYVAEGTDQDYFSDQDAGIKIASAKLAVSAGD